MRISGIIRRWRWRWGEKIRVMEEVDGMIEGEGGWPGACERKCRQGRVGFELGVIYYGIMVNQSGQCRAK